MAKRMFLRAYTRSAWGLDALEMSYADLARWLTAGGFPTKKSDVENARRPNASLVEHVVAKNEAADRFLAFVQSKFPMFEGHRIIIA
jgi:hypothetical protein